MHARRGAAGRLVAAWRRYATIVKFLYHVAV